MEGEKRNGEDDEEEEEVENAQEIVGFVVFMICFEKWCPKKLP